MILSKRLIIFELYSGCRSIIIIRTIKYLKANLKYWKDLRPYPWGQVNEKCTAKTPYDRYQDMNIAKYIKLGRFLWAGPVVKIKKLYLWHGESEDWKQDGWTELQRIVENFLTSETGELEHRIRPTGIGSWTRRRPRFSNCCCATKKMKIRLTIFLEIKV